MIGGGFSVEDKCVYINAGRSKVNMSKRNERRMTDRSRPTNHRPIAGWRGCVCRCGAYFFPFTELDLSDRLDWSSPPDRFPFLKKPKAHKFVCPFPLSNRKNREPAGP